MSSTGGGPPADFASQAGWSQADSHGQVLASLGDISFTESHVLTPTGAHPLAGTIWTAHNRVHTSRTIPGWAICLAIIFFVFCLLGLLFLLVKKQTMAGVVEVSVQGPGLFHVTHVPVHSFVDIETVHRQVNHARSLAAAASGTAPVPPPSLPGFPSPAAQPPPHPPAAPSAPAAPPAPKAQFNDSRSHWYDGTSWRDARLEVPPDAHIDRERDAWWDGGRWRPLP